VASENVQILSDETFADSIGGDEPVLVDFWAEWCGPCKMIAPILEEIADEQVGSVKIAKLNVDDAPDTARQYEVMSIPTMILFKDGQPVKKIVGAKPKDAILGELAEYL
jgi:thioredoxin 1